MNRAYISALAVFAFTTDAFGQDGAPMIKAKVMSAFVWGEDSTSDAVSSTIQDPLTGDSIPTLSYAGIEVSSRIGFESVSTSEISIFLNYISTIVNSTDSRLSVRYGGISVDEHSASPLSIVPRRQEPP
jgi:hypothetical protein